MVRPAPNSTPLERLLVAAGYRIDSRGGALVAVRSRDHRAVVVARADRSPADLEALFPSGSVRRTVVYDDEPGPEGRSAAAELGIEVIDPSTLGPALGEILLPPPSDPGAEAAAEDLEGPFPVSPGNARTIRPRIGRGEAQALAGVEGPRYTLRLVPYYVAPYRVRSPSPHGEAGPVLRRLIAVNATTRRAEVWEEADREVVAEISEPHQQLEPQVTEGLARPIAIDAIRRYHAVRVDHTEQHGGALVIETRRVSPAPDDVRLGPFTLVYVPHWYAEGMEGRVVLDAVTGLRIAGPDGSA
ncbi:MAG TPA: hypothetical protein VML94_00730 [Thermoplasmata archaeon]|nr:hypothetical protein [Thermoplasmata archaeon]